MHSKSVSVVRDFQVCYHLNGGRARSLSFNNQRFKLIYNTPTKASPGSIHIRTWQGEPYLSYLPFNSDEDTIKKFCEVKESSYQNGIVEGVKQCQDAIKQTLGLTT